MRHKTPWEWFCCCFDSYSRRHMYPIAAGADEQAVGDKAAVPDELAYGRAPRAVDYQPYSLKDYTERNYDAKKATGYWQLGKLGPDLESSELQAKVGAGGCGEGKGPRGRVGPGTGGSGVGEGAGPRPKNIIVCLSRCALPCA